MKKKVWIVIAVILALLVLTCMIFRNQIIVFWRDLTRPIYMEPVAEKPVIYLYPEVPTDVSVKLNLHGELLCTYPAYDDGWQMRANPDGTLTDAEGNVYSYLFWEGTDGAEYDWSSGWCVAGEDTAEFLRETLDALGLNARESNEFIVYWLPRMQNNAYNLITFQTDAYTDRAVLTIDPAPDSMLRVFMAWKPLTQPTAIEAPEIVPFERVGFTVVEWGGTEVK